MRTVSPRLFPLLACLVLGGIAGACACGGTDPGPPAAPEGPALLGLGVSPLYPVLPIGDVLQFRATGYFDDLTTIDMTDLVDWQSWNTEILDITEAMDWEGKALGVAEGRTKVRAVYREVISNEVSVTVVDAQVEQLTISPSPVTLTTDESLQLVAEAAFSDGSHGEVTGSVLWLTLDPSVVTVWPGGELRAEGEGLTYVVARWDGSAGDESEASVAVQVVEPNQSLVLPDLQVTGFSSSVIDDTVYWSVTVENRGGRPANTFWVEIWLDRAGSPPAPPAVGDGYEVVSVLGAGESTVLNFMFGDVPLGEYSSWLLVDSLGVVEELDEDNNVAGPVDFTVETVDPGSVDPEGVPDIELLWLEGFAVSEPDGVFFFIDLQNLGAGETGPFTLGVFADQANQPNATMQPDELVSVESIAPGEIRYVSVETAGQVSGLWHSWVLADPGDTVAESDESNNVADTLVFAD